MHLHEYQAKQLFSDYGIPVPAGQMLDDPQAVAGLINSLGGSAKDLSGVVAKIDATTARAKIQ